MVQELLAARVSLIPRPVQPRPAALEAAFLGHCPGEVRVQRLLDMQQVLDELRSAGFAEQVDALRSGSAGASLRALEHLPLPLRSRAEFYDIFPQANTLPTQYRSVLAGDRAWLPACVDDFFANGGIKLWVVKIPEQAIGGENPQQLFFPDSNTQLHDPRTLRGLATLIVINSIGLVALPDLERLQIPQRLPDVPRVRLDNPDPQFMPCSANLDDDHRERRNDDEIPSTSSPLGFAAIIQGLLRWASQHRPDWQFLMSMPLSYSDSLNSPNLDPAAAATIAALKQRDHAYRLRQMQFVYPYLREPGHSLRTAIGAIAGKQARQAQRVGIWSSVADQALQLNARLYPNPSIAETLAMRSEPGVSVLRFSRKAIRLDDERLSVPALPAADIKTTVNDKRYDGYRSAEIQRFMGYLQRAMRALGEQLIFNVDYRDPRPRLLLDRYFRTLYQRGALRGATTQQAFHIQQIPAGEGAMLFEIEIAPALPIEHIRLTFSNQDGHWSGGLNGGVSEGVNGGLSRG